MALPAFLEFNLSGHEIIQLARNDDFPPSASAVTRKLRHHQTLALTHITLIEETLCNNLYRGILNISGQDIRIVVKQSRNEGDVLEFVNQLKEEAASYCRNLESCQGDVVPLYYGLYEGSIEGRPLACILLEDCGDPCGGDLKNLDISIKLAIFDQFLTLHKRACILHDSAISSHILLRKSPDGHLVRIISFSDISSDHQCEWTARLVPDTKRPQEGVSCGELFFLEKDLQIWHNPFFYYKDRVLCEYDSHDSLERQKAKIDDEMKWLGADE